MRGPNLKIVTILIQKPIRFFFGKESGETNFIMVQVFIGFFPLSLTFSFFDLIV